MSSDYAVDRERWACMSIFDQMGNISSEVGRTIQTKKSGDTEKFEAALSRALDLFEATTEVQMRDKPYRAKEILRAEDQFLSLFFGKESEKADEQTLEKYFMQYAIAARLNR